VVIEAVAAVEDVPPTELPPLNDEIDLEALDRLFESAVNSGLFRFTVQGWHVFVASNGRLNICDPSETGDPSPVFEPGHSD